MNKVALVLASGGARGMAHIGVIEELEANGYEISAISGTSMGAVVGGIYAAGKLPEYKRFLLELDKTEVFKLLDFTFAKNGVIKAEKIFQELRSLIGDHFIEDFKIPFTAVATDIKNEKEVWLQKGNLWEALRASVAIPSVITPAKINGLELVDGGVLNPVPIQPIIRHSHDILMVVNVNSKVAYQFPEVAPQIQGEYSIRLNEFRNKWFKMLPKIKNDTEETLGYFGVINKSIDLLQDRLIQLSIEHAQPDILVDIPRDSCGTFEFYKAKELIEIGRQQCKISIYNFENKKAIADL